MVLGGSPSSQRKRFGAENQTRPVAVSGSLNAFNVRVWMTVADQVWIFVCALSQAAIGGWLSEASSGASNTQKKPISKPIRTGIRKDICALRIFSGPQPAELQLMPRHNQLCAVPHPASRRISLGSGDPRSDSVPGSKRPPPTAARMAAEWN